MWVEELASDVQEHSAPPDVCPTLLPKDTWWDICKGRMGRGKGEWGKEEFSKMSTDFFFSVPRHNIDCVIFCFSLILEYTCDTLSER